MARGIERRKIFLDDKDRESFLDLGHRKNPLLPEVSDPKSDNRQQNKSLASLGPSRFSDKLLAEKTIEDVLLHFGKAKKIARGRHREFVEKGIKQGTREDLQGGGLVRPACHARFKSPFNLANADQKDRASWKQIGGAARAGRSAGGETAGLLGRKAEEREKGDARILGSEDFVNEALNKAGEEWESQAAPRPPLEALLKAVTEAFDLSCQQLKSGSRRRPIVDARSIFARIAVRNHGYKGTEVAKVLSMSPHR